MDVGAFLNQLEDQLQHKEADIATTFPRTSAELAAYTRHVHRHPGSPSNRSPLVKPPLSASRFWRIINNRIDITKHLPVELTGLLGPAITYNLLHEGHFTAIHELTQAYHKATVDRENAKRYFRAVAQDGNNWVKVVFKCIAEEMEDAFPIEPVTVATQAFFTIPQLQESPPSLTQRTLKAVQQHVQDAQTASYMVTNFTTVQPVRVPYTSNFLSADEVDSHITTKGDLGEKNTRLHANQRRQVDHQSYRTVCIDWHPDGKDLWLIFITIYNSNNARIMDFCNNLMSLTTQEIKDESHRALRRFLMDKEWYQDIQITREQSLHSYHLTKILDAIMAVHTVMVPGNPNVARIAPITSAATMDNDVTNYTVRYIDYMTSTSIQEIEINSWEWENPTRQQLSEGQSFVSYDDVPGVHMRSLPGPHNRRSLNSSEQWADVNAMTTAKEPVGEPPSTGLKDFLEGTARDRDITELIAREFIHGRHSLNDPRFNTFPTEEPLNQFAQTHSKAFSTWQYQLYHSLQDCSLPAIYCAREVTTKLAPGLRIVKRPWFTHCEVLPNPQAA